MHGDYLDYQDREHEPQLKGLNLRARRMDRTGSLPRDPDVIMSKEEAYQALLRFIRDFDEMLEDCNDTGFETCEMTVGWKPASREEEEALDKGFRQRIREFRSLYYDMCTTWHWLSPELREAKLERR